jgi:hypothetical protein
MFRKNFAAITAALTLPFVLALTLLFAACPMPDDPSPGPFLEVPVISGVTGADGKLAINWGAVQDASSYDIYINAASEGENPPSTAAGNVTGLTAEINRDSAGTSLANSAEYYIWVRARNSATTSDYSARASGIPFKVSFTGYYRSGYGDGIEINGSSLSAYDDANKTVSYAGTIVYNNETAGILIIQITDGGTWGKTVGSYYAVAYELPSGNGLRQAAAYKEGGKNEGVGSLAEAIAEYTKENGYFSPPGGSLPDYVFAPTPPSALVVAGIDGKLVVSWTPVSGVDSYEVYLGTGDTPPATATKTVNTLFAELDGTNDTPYKVWIKAVKGGVKSDFSAVATGTPKAFAIPFTGYYKDPNWGDGFEISGNSFYSYMDGAKALAYAGTIVENVQFSSSSGVLIIKITDAGAWGKIVGNYYAVSYEVLDDQNVKEASASSEDYENPINNGLSTMAEAIAEYTAAKGYYGYFPAYPKYPGIYLGNLEGNWVNNSDFSWVVTISGDSYTDSSAKYAGTIVETSPSFVTSGIIYIHLTDAGTLSGTAGQYYAIAWRNKSSGNIEFAGANTQAYTDLSEAKNNLVAGPTYSQFYGYSYHDVDFLKGSWSTEDDDYESFVVITDYSYAQYMEQEDPDYLLFAGTIEEITDTTATEGFIYIKYTRVGDMGDWSDCVPGKYYAVRWINIGDGTITLIPAYKYQGLLEETSLTRAKGEFTVSNGYFDDDEAVFEQE